MALAPGTRLGAYEILSLLGKGGMGKVYRATDTKLGREVALKILPDAFTNDSKRLSRFRREAHFLATLNHPHIGAVYGLDDANGWQFLVLELVDSEPRQTPFAWKDSHRRGSRNGEARSQKPINHAFSSAPLRGQDRADSWNLAL
jgi:serine/threonine protein kinase